MIRAIGVFVVVSRTRDTDSMCVGNGRKRTTSQTWRNLGGLKHDLHPADRIIKPLHEILTASALTLTRNSHTLTPWGPRPASGADSCRSGHGPHWTTCKGCALRECFRRGNTSAGAHPMGNGPLPTTMHMLIHLPLIGPSPRILALVISRQHRHSVAFGKKAGVSASGTISPQLNSVIGSTSTSRC